MRSSVTLLIPNVSTITWVYYTHQYQGHDLETQALGFSGGEVG